VLTQNANPTQVSISEKGLSNLYWDALAEVNSTQRGRTILLTQNLLVFSAELWNTPTQWVRTGYLHKSSHFGEPGDQACTVKVIQEGSVRTNGDAITNITYTVEPPRCNQAPEILPLEKAKEEREPHQEIFGKTKLLPVKLGRVQSLFGDTPEKNMVFLLDSSSSFDSVRVAANQDLKENIRLLREDQYFAIGYVSENRKWFHDAELVQANDENKKEAYRFIDRSPHGGLSETFSTAFKEVLARNPQIERIYSYTDGAYFVNEDEMRNCEAFFSTSSVPSTIRYLERSDLEVGVYQEVSGFGKNLNLEAIKFETRLGINFLRAMSNQKLITLIE
jgi:hypothetical protein